MNKKKNNEINQKIDNELKKEALKQKYGAAFMGGENTPPHIESEWLNYIEKYEEQFNKNEITTVWKFIGKPSYPKISEIPPESTTIELDRLLQVMAEHNVYLDISSEVEDKELYRFLTEELFQEEMDNIRIPGMSHNFIYEEYYPNAEQDIEMAFEYFFNSTLNKRRTFDGKGYDMLYIDKENFKNANNENIDKSIVIKTISNFLDSFDYFKIASNKIQQLTINEDKTDAHLDFKIQYNGCFKTKKEHVEFKGNGIFKLKPSDYGGWDIYHIQLPGLNL